MKILLVMSAICIASTMGVVSPTQMATLFDFDTFDQCRASWPVNDADVTNFVRGTYGSTPENLKCLLKCFFTRRGVLSNTGAVNDLGPFLKTAGLGAGRANTACRKLPASLVCQHAMNLAKCIHDNA